MALENHACFVPQELILAILNHLRNFFTRAFSPLISIRPIDHRHGPTPNGFYINSRIEAMTKSKVGVVGHLTRRAVILGHRTLVP